jgi:NADPH:quinone reductase-like Zn-dependent oxidoreductase
MTPHSAHWAQRTVIEKDRSVRLPAGLDPAAVAAAINPVMSSWVAARHRVAFKRGSRVLILGATGNVGRAAIQVAKRFGAKEVIGAGRNPQRLDELRSTRTQIVASGIGSVPGRCFRCEIPRVAKAVTKGVFDIRSQSVPLSDVTDVWDETLESDRRVVLVP